MNRYKVVAPNGVHSMAAGQSWAKDHYILAGQVPNNLIAAWIADGAVVEELDEPRCAGVNAKGQPCKRPPLDGSEYCKTHQPGADQAGE